MATPVNEEELRLEIIILKREGYSQRAIAGKLEISRKIVRRVLKQHDKNRTCGHDVLEQHRKAKRKSKLDEWTPFMEGKLKKFPKITAVRMLEELRGAGGLRGGDHDSP
jgi:transposase